MFSDLQRPRLTWEPKPTEKPNKYLPLTVGYIECPAVKTVVEYPPQVFLLSWPPGSYKRLPQQAIYVRRLDTSSPSVPKEEQVVVTERVGERVTGIFTSATIVSSSQQLNGSATVALAYVINGSFLLVTGRNTSNSSNSSSKATEEGRRLFAKFLHSPLEKLGSERRTVNGGLGN
ncbi:hypothetical protein K435DRAFT_800444 [Dendrothele bispora CBS 962.96]|uniref:Uncharacterized protein n=1 Tax=Dendrothele bispora (strain CBS 962.96) TaxID=1314807 RepID=A0A4V4HEU3_DENBC|nr:hypothetical protein K435DRAFT_800444 [Dendrothele bispora CBS 962.96]